MSEQVNYQLRPFQGADFAKNIIIKVNGEPLDLTGAQVFMQFRSKPNGELLLDLDDSGYITLGDAANGEIVINVPAAVTDELAWALGYYDLRIQLAGGQTIKPMYGQVRMFNGVTTDG